MLKDSSLLKVTSLLGIAVKSSGSHSQPQATGVIRGVDTYIDTSKIHGVKRPATTECTASVCRMGTSTRVAISTFSSRLSGYVFLVLVRHKVEPFIETPIQCHICCAMHIKSTCRNSPVYFRCSGPHLRATCDAQATAVRCYNCGKEHEVTSHRCMKWKHELEIRRLRQQDKLDCKTAQGTANNTLEQGPTSEYFPPLGMQNQHHASSNKSYAGNDDKDTTAFRVNVAPILSKHFTAK